MTDDRKILVSRAEIARRRRTSFNARASFAVDDIPVNHATRYIFDAYTEGYIATREEVRKLLREHYSANEK